jgi:RNA polymerase sigma-70 factor (ECF subfamily)
MSILGRHDILASLGSLRRYARALTRDDSRAEDLVHDTLLRALERRASYRDGDDLGAWLRAILHNTFVDQRRSAEAEARRGGEITRTRSDAEPPAQDLHLQLKDTMRAFDSLPEEQRSALYLVAVEDLSYADAAAALNIPLGTLMSRIGRARAALREAQDAAEDPAPVRPLLRLVSVKP